MRIFASIRLSDFDDVFPNNRNTQNKGKKVLKKLWCCVSVGVQQDSFGINDDNVKSFKADALGVNPLVRANGEIVGCVWVYMRKMELRYWWEHSDEKNKNKLVE